MGGSSSDQLPSSHQNNNNNHPTKVRQTDPAGNLTGWIEALGVDASYRPPPIDRADPKPVACFYVARRTAASAAQQTPLASVSPPSAAAAVAGDELHRAIYLPQRTLHALVSRLAAKWHFDAGRVVRTVRVVEPRGIEVVVDDEVVRELPEGLDMTMEVVEVPLAGVTGGEVVKREWEMMVDGAEDAHGEAEMLSPMSGGGGVGGAAAEGSGVVLRLRF
jgi:hypothetical protein